MGASHSCENTDEVPVGSSQGDTITPSGNTVEGFIEVTRRKKMKFTPNLNVKRKVNKSK